MNKSAFYITFFIFLGFVKAQTIPQPLFPFQQNISHQLVNDVSHFISVGNALVTAPFKLNAEGYGNLLGGAVLFSGLFLVDKNVKQFAQANQSHNADALFKIDNYWGSSPTYQAAMGLYGVGFLFGNKKLRTMGLHAFEAMFYTRLITGQLKNIFGRRRPYKGESHLVFKPFDGNRDFKAFPSGHTTGAVAFATVMAGSYDNRAWQVFWYGTATLVAGARIYNNVHWLSDTVLASVIGYGVGRMVLQHKPNTNNNMVDYVFSPLVLPDGAGISFGVSF